MSNAAQKASEADRNFFPYQRWANELPRLTDSYRAAQPCPHIKLVNFFDDSVAKQLLADFPSPKDGTWVHWAHYNEKKLGKSKRVEFSPFTNQVLDELTSLKFTCWLSELTGIANLIADPGFSDGGLHQSERGGFLNIHTDYSSHYVHRSWRRRLNVLIYLNEGWQDSWGGHLELWDAGTTQCDKKFAPLFNHCVIFTTSELSPHGHPEPLQCPDGVTRKSLALYYYTEDLSDSPVRTTNYRGRPTDSLTKKLLIWTDKKAVHIYSVVKRRFGFNDRLISKILKLLSTRKG